MTLTIQDETDQAELAGSVHDGDGPQVARLASTLILEGRDRLVRRACLECAGLAHPKHCQALIDFFVTRRKAATESENLADVIASIMAGVRSGRKDVGNSGSGRASIDALLDELKRAHSQTPEAASRAVSNLQKLPAKLGVTWAGIVALARDAVNDLIPQEPLERNHKLTDLFKGKHMTDSSCSHGEADPDLKLCALWAYARGPSGSTQDFCKPCPLSNVMTKTCVVPQEDMGHAKEVRCVLKCGHV